MKTKLVLYGASFVAVIAFALLFGLGVIHQNAVSEYVVFVLLGSLASVLTWGILSSSGEISGSPYGINVKLAGAIVPFVTIVGGGLWMWSKSDSFDIKVKFVGEQNEPIAVSGRGRLEVGAYVSEFTFSKASLISFDHVLHNAQGQEATFALLDAPGYAVIDPSHKFPLEPNALFVVRVRAVKVANVSGTVTFQGARVAGATITVAGASCAGDSDPKGYFEFPCPDLPLPAKLQIRVPEAYLKRVCTNDVPAPTMSNNDIVLKECANADAAPTVTGTIPPPPLPPCGAGNAEKALRNLLQGTQQKVTVTATLGPSGHFGSVSVNGGPADLKPKIEGAPIDSPTTCKPVTVTVSTP